LPHHHALGVTEYIDLPLGEGRTHCRRMHERADRGDRDGLFGGRWWVGSRLDSFPDRLAEIVFHFRGRCIAILQARAREIPVNIRMRARQRVAAVLATAAGFW